MKIIYTDINAVNDRQREADFVKEAEKRFLLQMEKAVEKIVKSGKKIIFLSGPSCSGKTTSGRILCDELKNRGKCVKEISIDDFFYGKEEALRIARERGTKVDIESAAAIDLEYLCVCAEGIMKGESVMLPKFDFNVSARTGYEKWTPPSGETIVIFEGIQAIYPEVLEIFKEKDSISMYIYPESHVQTGDEVFASDEMRFLRRLVRDERSRNSPPKRTLELWEGVRENEEKNIFPYVGGVDIRIDSSFAYEPCMIKDRALELLSSVENDDVYKEKVGKIIEKLRKIPSMTDRYLPEDSLFREFIGR